MSKPVAKQSIYTQLRREAEDRLEAGTTNASSWSLGVDALQMLHRLSSNPETAADALKLLHELQVHQVELDLQSEQLRLNEHRVADLFYRELYEYAPFAYLLVDFLGQIIDSNYAAAELFGVSRDGLVGGAISGLFSLDGHSLLPELLKRVDQDDVEQSCVLALASAKSGARLLRIVISSSADKRYALLVCCECA